MFILIHHADVKVIKSKVKVVRKSTSGNDSDLGTALSDIWFWFSREKHELLTISTIVFERVLNTGDNIQNMCCVTHLSSSFDSIVALGN